MEIGEYIRTRLGISKIIGDLGPNLYEVDKNGHPMQNKFSYYIENGEILKHSENILDLINVGDFVNGYRVYHITGHYVAVESAEKYDLCFEEQDIRTIVTREQFKSMQYKLEAEDK